MKYSLDKYKFYQYLNKKGGTTVAAISTYCGRKVTGKANCDPADGFNLETGKNLAAARCNSKIAHKRRDRAFSKYQEAERQVAKAQKFLSDMTEYYNSAYDEMLEADNELEAILTNLDGE